MFPGFVLIKDGKTTDTEMTAMKEKVSIHRQKLKAGLPWWSSGQDSMFPLQGHRFNPWSGNGSCHAACCSPKRKLKACKAMQGLMGKNHRWQRRAGIIQRLNWVLEGRNK